MKGSKEHIDELIERYVLEKMSPVERSDFEREIKADPLLQELVAESQTLKEVIQSDANVQQFTRTLETVIDEHKPTRSFSLWWKVAAVLIMVMSGVVWLFQINESQDPSTLALNYFEPFPDLITSRDEADSLVSQAMTAYNTGAYVQAIPTLEKLVNPEVPLFEFYLGVSFQASGQYDQALEVWLKMEAYNDPSLHSSIRWYKALTLLGLNQSDPAKQILEELANQSSSVQSRARDLLDEL